MTLVPQGMPPIPVLFDQDLRQLLSMPDAIHVMRDAIRLFAGGELAAPRACGFRLEAEPSCSLETDWLEAGAHVQAVGPKHELAHELLIACCDGTPVAGS